MNKFATGIIGLALATALLGAAGCSDSDDASLLNTWERHVVDAQNREFDVAIVFEADGTFQFDLLSPTTGHTSTLLKYRREANHLVFYDDPECNSEGTYAYSISGSRLTLTGLEDSCAARLAILNAVWTVQ